MKVGRITQLSEGYQPVMLGTQSISIGEKVYFSDDMIKECARRLKA